MTDAYKLSESSRQVERVIKTSRASRLIHPPSFNAQHADGIAINVGDVN